RERLRRRPPPPGPCPVPGTGPGIGNGPSPPGAGGGLSDPFICGGTEPLGVSDWPAKDGGERRLRLRRLCGCRLSGVIQTQNLGCCSPSSCRKPTIGAEMPLSKRPAGDLRSSHGGADVVSDSFLPNASELRPSQDFFPYNDTNPCPKAF